VWWWYGACNYCVKEETKATLQHSESMLRFPDLLMNSTHLPQPPMNPWDNAPEPVFPSIPGSAERSRTEIP